MTTSNDSTQERFLVQVVVSVRYKGVERTLDSRGQCVECAVAGEDDAIELAKEALDLATQKLLTRQSPETRPQ